MGMSTNLKTSRDEIGPGATLLCDLIRALQFHNVNLIH